jgi:hypothetical protein
MSPADVLTLVAAVVLLCACVPILGFGARAWSLATLAAHSARAAEVQADETAETIRQAREAVTRSHLGPQSRPPTDDEIREAILSQRVSPNGEYTTSGDVTPEELTMHMSGGEFRSP